MTWGPTNEWGLYDKSRREVGAEDPPCHSKCAVNSQADRRRGRDHEPPSANITIGALEPGTRMGPQRLLRMMDIR